MPRTRNRLEDNTTKEARRYKQRRRKGEENVDSSGAASCNVFSQGDVEERERLDVVL